MIRAVLFDVGGPLDLETKFEAAIDADLRSGLELEGFAVTDEAWDAAHRYGIESFSPRLYHSIVWQLTSGDHAASMRVYDRMQARADQRTGLFELRPGIAEVLVALKARGLRLGLAANQPLRALRSLDEAGIGHYFENDGVSGVYGWRKPDVRLFLRACEDLGVQPEECIMVGDRIDNDVVPAHLLRHAHRTDPDGTASRSAASFLGRTPRRRGRGRCRHPARHRDAARAGAVVIRETVR